MAEPGTAKKPISALLLLQLAGLCHAFAYGGDAIPTVETIVSRMAMARLENRTRLRPYSVTRDYRLFGKEKQRSEVIVDVSFVPPAFKRFSIREANGIGLGEKIVRQMLENETNIVKNHTSTDIAPDNYDFRFIREEELNGQKCYVLGILPLRKDKTLLRGQTWVDSTTYLIHRTEGEPGKEPSWWLRDAHILLIYGDVGGMWLQTSSESNAEVRLLGRHTMQSRDVEYKLGDVVAARGNLQRYGR